MSLSDKKIIVGGEEVPVYPEEDVKEFIKKIKDKIKKGQCPDCSEKVDKCKCNHKTLFVTIDRNFIDKEAGEKLT